MDSLKELNKEILACYKCHLRETASAPVLGCGQVGAKYLLLGEAPGHDEDIAKVPFVGAAGKRLDKLLALAGISPNDCYLSNVCRCRPPKNKTPAKKEIRACLPFLWRELLLVRPTYLITLGATPLSVFSPYPISVMHGTQFEFEVKE